MKPKDYKKTFRLEENKCFNREKFLALFMEDFSTALSSHQQMNVTHFSNEVMAIKNKFDNIFINTLITLENSEKFWKYIYAIKIIPIRNLYFKDWNKSVLDHRRKTDPDFNRRYTEYLWHKEDEENQKQEWRKAFEETWARNSTRARPWENTADVLRSRESSEFAKILGLDTHTDIKKETIISQFRIMAKLIHPDVNNTLGANEKFILLQNAKENLLKILEKYPHREDETSETEDSDEQYQEV
jgi:hypothetical protein